MWFWRTPNASRVRRSRERFSMPRRKSQGGGKGEKAPVPNETAQTHRFESLVRCLSIDPAHWSWPTLPPGGHSERQPCPKHRVCGPWARPLCLPLPRRRSVSMLTLGQSTCSHFGKHSFCCRKWSGMVSSISVGKHRSAHEHPKPGSAAGDQEPLACNDARLLKRERIALLVVDLLHKIVQQVNLSRGRPAIRLAASGPRPGVPPATCHQVEHKYVDGYHENGEQDRHKDLHCRPILGEPVRCLPTRHHSPAKARWNVGHPSRGPQCPAASPLLTEPSPKRSILNMVKNACNGVSPGPIKAPSWAMSLSPQRRRTVRKGLPRGLNRSKETPRT